jgi:hypothetical protein
MARTATKRRKRSISRYENTVADIWGERWVVGEVRPTNYRFSIYMGWPAREGASRSGKAAVIVTPALAKHMRETAQRPYATPLPISDNARRRVRELLNVGHREWIDNRVNWWLDRIDDLGSLSAAAFVAKHGRKGWTRMGTMSTTLVWQMRVALLGRQRPPIGWWKSPKVRALVNSKLPLNEIAKRLDLAPSTVYGIRYRLKKLETSNGHKRRKSRT